MEKRSADEVARGLLGRPLELSQIALVVRDIEKTMEQYSKLLGWGPWKVYRNEAPRHHSTELRGESVEYTMLHAEVDVNGIGFELIQPLEGPSIFKEWLDEHGEGIHHVAVLVHDPEESALLKERFKEEGADVLMGGRLADSIEYYYLDTQPSLKLILESGSGHGEGNALPFGPDYTFG